MRSELEVLLTIVNCLIGLCSYYGQHNRPSLVKLTWCSVQCHILKFVLTPTAVWRLFRKDSKQPSAGGTYGRTDGPLVCRVLVTTLVTLPRHVIKRKLAPLWCHIIDCLVTDRKQLTLLQVHTAGVSSLFWVSRRTKIDQYHFVCGSRNNFTLWLLNLYSPLPSRIPVTREGHRV